MFPQKRKFSELEADDLAIDAKNSLENDAVKEYTEMYCPFVRGKSNVHPRRGAQCGNLKGYSAASM